MEWSEIWTIISPYLNTTAIITAVGVVIKIVMSIRSEARRTAQTLKNNTDILDTFKQALPSELVVSIEKLAGEEFRKMVEELEVVFIEPLKKLDADVVAVARAVVCLKTIPENLRNEILALMDEDKKPEETQKVVLEINPELKKMEEKKDEQPRIFTE